MRQVVRVLLYTALPALAALNVWAFPRLFGVGYVAWFLDDGPLIGVAVGFLALVWDELEVRKGLLALNPVRYLSTCLSLAGVLIFSVGTSLTGRTREATLGALWDGVVATVMGLVITVLALGWLVVVAPLNWAVTLVAGAPARLHLRGARTRAVVYETSRRVDVAEEPVDALAGGTDVSLGRHPFAVTQALVSVVTYLVALAVG